MTDTTTIDIEDDDAQPSISIQEILVPIWAARKRIILISLAAGILTYLVNFFLLSPYFKSTATLLPETDKGKLLSMGQFTDVAQKLLGDNIPGSEIARLYPTVVSSETILRSVIEQRYASREFKDSVDLIQFFEFTNDTPEENMYRALLKLRALMTATTEAKTGIVTITVEMTEPQLAADVLNALVAELDHFMRSKKVTTASEQLNWIELRLKEVEVELAKAENLLKDFRENNRRLADSPQLVLKQDRLIRDVTVKSTVFIELKKQFELAKLEEIKNITIVNVLDPGRPSVKKERPKRLINSAIVLFFAFICSASYFSFWSLYRTKATEFLSSFTTGQVNRNPL